MPKDNCGAKDSREMERDYRANPNAGFENAQDEKPVTMSMASVQTYNGLIAILGTVVGDFKDSPSPVEVAEHLVEEHNAGLSDICPDCKAPLVKSFYELDDGSGWVGGWSCECQPTEEQKEACCDDGDPDDGDPDVKGSDAEDIEVGGTDDRDKEPAQIKDLPGRGHRYISRFNSANSRVGYTYFHNCGHNCDPSDSQ